MLADILIHPGKSSGLNSFGLMWCNGISLMSLPWMCTLATLLIVPQASSFFFFFFLEREEYLIMVTCDFLDFPVTGIVCGPALLVWTLIRGDLMMTINFPSLFSPGFLVRSGFHLKYIANII